MESEPIILVFHLETELNNYYVRNLSNRISFFTAIKKTVLFELLLVFLNNYTRINQSFNPFQNWSLVFML